MRSRSRRSTEAPRRPPAARRGVDVYLLPAIVGGGLGDIEEVLGAGRALARAGFAIHLYRGPGRPWPAGVEGPWDWPPVRTVRNLRPRGRAALTVTPAWGVSAAGATPGPFGRAGPWAEEAAAVEAAYGPDRTIHVSLEEFARTLTSVRENRERYREGGVPSRELSATTRRKDAQDGRSEFLRAFRRFRAFDRPNVLHLFGGFAPDRAFGCEHPESVQTGPLWPGRYRRRRSLGAPTGRGVWYASPASSEAIAPEVFAGLRRARRRVRLTIRSPRAWRVAPPPELGELHLGAFGPARWRRRFAQADLRIVTGSRSLLEALELGAPFLYFNGVVGRGLRRRRHRPEKIDALLAAGRRAGWPSDLLRDLADFARGRRLRSVVRRAVERRGGWGRLLPPLGLDGYPEDRRDLGALVVGVARQLARPTGSASAIVAAVRGSAPQPRRSAGRPHRPGTSGAGRGGPT